MRRKKKLEHVKNTVRGPAVCLLVLGVTALLLDAMAAAMLLNESIHSQQQYESGEITELEFEERDDALASAFGIVPLMALAHGLTTFGAISMLRLGSYSMAQAGASMALIPFCSPILLVGIPFAFWAFSALAEPRVRSAFRNK